MDDRTRIGANVRSARLRRGMSLAVVAGLAGRSAAWLSLIERGLRPLERRSDLAALANALQISPVDLTGQPYVPDDGKHPAAAADATIVRVRQAIQDLPDPAAADEPDRLVADVETLTDLRLSLDLAGLGAALPGLLRRLRATIPVVTRAEDRARLLRAYFWTAQGAQSLTRNLGHLDLAWVAAGHMRTTAEDIDDPVWLSASEFARAHALIPAGAARAALAYASAGADLASTAAGPDAAAAHGALQLVGAYAAALAGRLDEADDRLTTADRLAAGKTGPTFTRGFSFGAPNVVLHRMSVAVESGKPAQVAAAAAKLPAGALPSAERRATYWIDLGRAYAQMRRDDDAIQVLRWAEEIAPLRVRLHPLVREAVAGMVERRARAAVGRELRGLAYRMGLPH